MDKRRAVSVLLGIGALALGLAASEAISTQPIQGKPRTEDVLQRVEKERKEINQTVALSVAQSKETEVEMLVAEQHERRKELEKRKEEFEQQHPWMDFVATWYTAGTGKGITKTGTHVSERTIAVDPTLIPLGSTLELAFEDGHHEIRVAEDTGSAIHGNIVDVFEKSKEKALALGRQAIKLRVLEEGKTGS